jgi:hypothetical protein
MRRRPIRVVALSVILLTSLVSSGVGENPSISDDQDAEIINTNCVDKWCIAETSNFRVCSELTLQDACRLARCAEALRGRLSSTWLGDQVQQNWSPKCQIILYATKRHYIAAVGRGSERTLGSSRIDTRGDRITLRRIDLVGESVDYLSAALPHELTHVVVRDRFVTNGLPRWADEGMALLADSLHKQQLHDRDLQSALAAGNHCNVADLLCAEDYPKDVATFYAQSASLTRFLVVQKGPQAFVDFIVKAERDGTEQSLKSCYSFVSISALDRTWKRSVPDLTPGAKVLDSHFNVHMTAHTVALVP